jgi:AcrR family transcriptional regulator
MAEPQHRPKSDQDPPSPLTKEERAERQRLGEALIELCYERGFAALTVAALCRRAGVQRPVFERHFIDLDDCFHQFYRQIRDDFFSRLSAAIEGVAGWRGRLRAAAYFLLDFFAEDPKVTYFGMVEVRRAGEQTQLLFAEVFEAIFDLLDQGREQRPDPQAISRATAESIAGGIFAQLYTAIGQGQPLRPEAVPQMLHAAVLPYLGPEAAEEELSLPFGGVG